MPRTDKFSPLIERMLEAPEHAVAELRANPSGFEASIVNDEGGSHVAEAVLPLRSALAFALFGQNGSAIPVDSAQGNPAFATREDMLAHVDPRSMDGRLLCVARAEGPPIFGIWAPWEETRDWNLPASIRQLGDAQRASAVALFSIASSTRIADAASAFGLPPFQQRVVAAVTITGSVKRAAVELGISYAAAREAASAAARKIQAPNTTALVRAVVAAAFGILPSAVRGSLVLSDKLAISERQARIALLIADGFSREDTARTLGTSTAVIRKELQSLFAILGISTAADLARLITEMQALHLFAQAIDNPLGFLDPVIEPSRFSVRADGRGLICWSDYGPASGKPVLVVHSNWCCRAVPLPLVKELQRRGWRPVAIDRPGFGATDLGSSTKDDPFTQAVADTRQVLDELKIAKVPIVARCGAQFVHAFAARYPERVAQVVLVSPSPQARDDGKRDSPVGAFKEAFYRSPRLVELFYRVISSQFTFERVEKLMRSLTRGSPVDEALCDDPQFIRDRFRALRPFACGGYTGGILEELVISHGGWPFAPLPSRNWIVLQGQDDYHNSFAEVAEYWGPLLPDARIERIAGGGRFMTSSHPDLIVDHLEMLDLE